MLLPQKALLVDNCAVGNQAGVMCLTDLYLTALSNLLLQEVISVIAWVGCAVWVFFFPFTVPGMKMWQINPHFVPSSCHQDTWFEDVLDL